MHKVELDKLLDAFNAYKFATLPSRISHKPTGGRREPAEQEAAFTDAKAALLAALAELGIDAS